MIEKAVYGKKIGMTQFFVNEELVPVTVVKVEPNFVVQKKNLAADGYASVQVGFIDKKKSKTNAPEQGHFKKSGVDFKRFLREIKFGDCEKFEVANVLDVNQFNSGDFVDVTGISKGKGFAGAIKRHNQRSGPSGHGSGYHRWAGSMTSSARLSHVLKGKKLPGHMGVDKITTQNLIVISVDSERSLLIIKGCVPGAKNSIVFIKNAVKKNIKN